MEKPIQSLPPSSFLAIGHPQKEDISFSYYIQTGFIDKKLNNSREEVWKRKVEVFYLGKATGEYFYQILTYTAECYINGKLQSYGLREKMIYAFDDVRFRVNEEGRIIKINNIPALKERWKEISNEIRIHNKGESLENYLAYVEEVIDNESLLISFISQYNMYGLFFNGLMADDYKKGVIKTIYRKENILPEDIEIKEQWLVSESNVEQQKLCFTISAEEIPSIEESTQSFQSQSINCQSKFTYQKGFLIGGNLKNDYIQYQTKYSITWMGY